MPRKTIKKVDATKGEVAVRIDARFATQGIAVVSYAIKGAGAGIADIDSVNLATESGKEITVPVPVNDIETCRVFIRGQYTPAPGHNQVAVDYTFVQGGVQVQPDGICKNEDEDEEDGIEATAHTFEFKK